MRDMVNRQTNKKDDKEFLCRELELYNRDIGRLGASQVALVVKNPPASAGEIRDADLILGLGRSPGEGYGNPLQYSCLENPMDRGAWWVQSIVLQRV